MNKQQILDKIEDKPIYHADNGSSWIKDCDCKEDVMHFYNESYKFIELYCSICDKSLRRVEENE